MTTSVFSTVDRLSSRIKLLDRLIDTVATRLLPQGQASAYDCPSGWLWTIQCGNYCNPTIDIQYSTEIECCDLFMSCYWLTVGCDNCTP